MCTKLVHRVNRGYFRTKEEKKTHFAGEQRLPNILAVLTPIPLIYLFLPVFKYHFAVIRRGLCAAPYPTPPVISHRGVYAPAKKASPAFFSHTKYVSEVSLLLFTAGSYQLALTLFIESCRSCTDQPPKSTDHSKFRHRLFQLCQSCLMQFLDTWGIQHIGFLQQTHLPRNLATGMQFLWEACAASAPCSVGQPHLCLLSAFISFL